MRDAYDQFNLMELPQRKSKEQASLYFDSNTFKRRVPRGIFPDAKRPRVVLRPPGDSLEADRKVIDSTIDTMTKFERDPIAYMMEQELAKNIEMTQNELSAEIKTITNLQNIKHSLKSDLDDH